MEVGVSLEIGATAVDERTGEDIPWEGVGVTAPEDVPTVEGDTEDGVGEGVLPVCSEVEASSEDVSTKW